MENCIFCKIIKGEIPSIKVFENNCVIVFLDINPIEKGHMLFVPKCHWKNLAEIDIVSEIEYYGELMYLIQVATRAIISTGIADGANILQCNNACAGQTVDHLHFHLIPRYGEEPITEPQFHSGNAKYEDGEAKQIAEKISKCMLEIIKDEDILL